ncbi:hypothetical protein ACUSIJ_27555 [Pseudochelatococcus sp. B33]
MKKAVTAIHNLIQAMSIRDWRLRLEQGILEQGILAFGWQRAGQMQQVGNRVEGKPEWSMTMRY